MRRARKPAIVAALALLAVWLAFFDSHSVYRRVRWHHELARTRAENADLERRISDLEHRLEDAGSDEVIEKIAREQYGMRRPGETVYRIEPKE